MQLNFKTVKNVVVIYEDGSSEEFDLPPGAGFYRHAYTYSQDEKKRVTGVIQTHEVYWTEKKEVSNGAT